MKFRKHLWNELTAFSEEAGELRLGSHCLLLVVKINNGYSGHILFIRSDPGPHKSTEVTKAIFYLKSRTQQLENKEEQC